MPKCKTCKNSFGLLQLKNGKCKSCINIETPPCRGCNKNFNEDDLIEGYCTPCYKTESERRKVKQQESQERKVVENKKNEQDKKYREFILTTETQVDLVIVKRLEIISAECVFGMNIFKDLFSGIRDIVGGRNKSGQNALRDARREVLEELKKEAISIGANAVIAVDLDYSEISGQGKSMLFVVASGTAVIVKI